MTRSIAALALLLALPVSAAAGTQGQMTGGATHKPAVTCPKGKTAAADGTCVSTKNGKMGFDLAPPDDNNASSSQTGGTRSVSKSQNGHH